MLFKGALHRHPVHFCIFSDPVSDRLINLVSMASLISSFSSQSGLSDDSYMCWGFDSNLALLIIHLCSAFDLGFTSDFSRIFNDFLLSYFQGYGRSSISDSSSCNTGFSIGLVSSTQRSLWNMRCSFCFRITSARDSAFHFLFHSSSFTFHNTTLVCFAPPD